ncbi:MAG: enhanced serine sensitivity protein SseB [Oscillospiraceae bacterium]|nr:enhanced serine sensitivity protein SseB [Oscillospiraceae bacterium]
MNLDELLKNAINDPSRRTIFLQALIRSDIFVICRNPVKLEKNQQGVHLDLVTVRNSDGEVFIPFFTSHKELQKFVRRYTECCQINCLRFFGLIQNMSAVLNPNSYGKEFSSPEIRSVLNIAKNLHIKAISYNEFETLSYSKPERSLEHITKPASKFFSTHPNVDRAFIVEMQKGNEKPQLLIVVDMLGNTRKLFVDLARYLARSSDNENHHLYFLSYEQPLAKKAVINMTPFYVRNTRRYFQR